MIDTVIEVGMVVELNGQDVAKVLEVSGNQIIIQKLLVDGEHIQTVEMEQITDSTSWEVFVLWVQSGGVKRIYGNCCKCGKYKKLAEDSIFYICEDCKN